MRGDSYSATAKFLHWTIALAILVMLGLGWSFDLAPRGSTLKFIMIQAHKSLGITILLLSLFRLGWRLAHRAPALPPDMPRWEKGAAHTVHVLLYVLMIGMPLSGWAMVSASPRQIPTILYGVLPWPNLPLTPDKDISGLFAGMHNNAAIVLGVLLIGHIGAALKHHFINRDDVLLRMLPHHCAAGLEKLRRKA